MTDKKAIEHAKAIVAHCEEQRGCQNCVFRRFGGAMWNCEIDAFSLRAVVSNYEAKRKNGGYI